MEAQKRHSESCSQAFSVSTIVAKGILAIVVDQIFEVGLPLGGFCQERRPFFGGLHTNHVNGLVESEICIERGLELQNSKLWCDSVHPAAVQFQTLSQPRFQRLHTSRAHGTP